MIFYRLAHFTPFVREKVAPGGGVASTAKSERLVPRVLALLNDPRVPDGWRCRETGAHTVCLRSSACLPLLPDLLRRQDMARHLACSLSGIRLEIGLGGRVRTYDPVSPSHVRYQSALHPDIHATLRKSSL